MYRPLIGMCEKREAHQMNYMSVYMRKEMKHEKRCIWERELRHRKVKLHKTIKLHRCLKAERKSYEMIYVAQQINTKKLNIAKKSIDVY